MEKWGIGRLIRVQVPLMDPDAPIPLPLAIIDPIAPLPYKIILSLQKFNRLLI